MTHVARELRSGPDGQLFFPDLSERRVRALVVMAAHHPDERFGASALVDVMRLAIALESRSPKASLQLTNALKSVPAALERLERRRSGALAREAFRRVLGETDTKRAPQHDAAPHPGTVRVADLNRTGINPGLDPAEARARRGRSR